ncbi:T9SS type A sorting domain-containing protein [Candidatus Kryptonium thompsonii]|uniref:T9SS type A sorting domain-containing protein n=1 Tax=Candidatus Kryptonium thompsonii TaxID=1633631 RepID=UPI000707E139|nr:T9SS type A sorting domain-containing protein [Candidatus Kryptonium thompsoni]CUS97648.1 Por secretion system C-terminal sorting domain-containing protein [Candidatus Kryptonium thompsoni]
MRKAILFLTLFLYTISFTQTPMSGTYYIGDPGTKPGGGDPEFTTLFAACSTLTANGINGPVIMYFTQSKTYIEPTDVYLGVNGTSSTNTITFKPYYGVVCTLSFTSTQIRSSGIDGHWVIGTNNYNVQTSLIPTHYVTIDGSNSDGGTSKDLTILGGATSGQKSVIRVFGNNDYITIKNCIIINRSSSASSTAPIQFTNRNDGTNNYTPDYYTIDNNTLESLSGNGGLGLFLSNSGTPTVGMTGVTISNNIISHRGTRGIMCNYVNDANIYGNTISADMQMASAAGAGIWLSTGTSASGTFNIYNNRFTNLRFLNNTAGVSNGYIAIDNQLASPKVVNIYNNFITGFVTTSAVSNSKIYGIRHISTSTSNIYFNTIVLPEMVDMSNFGSSFIAGIAFATAATPEASPSGTVNIKNNIIISNETSMKTWGIRRVGTSGTFNSDYNNIYFVPSDSNFTGFWNNTNQKTLADWQSASGKDANSVSKNVTFVSGTDLHLSGSSIKDPDLVGTPISGITTDIDGNTRHSTYPFKGADEGQLPIVSAQKVFDNGGTSTNPGAQNYPVLAINFTVDDGYARLAGLTVRKFLNAGGTLAGDAEVSVEAWNDVNGNNQADSGEELGSGTFSSNVATINFSTSQTITPGPGLRILLTIDVDPSADPSHWVALRVESPSDVNVTSPAEKSSTNYPLQNQQDISLPVQVVGISYEVSGATVKLRIRTQVESNEFLGFNIYRSDDGIKYVLVGSYSSNAELKAKGSSAFGAEYVFVDKGLSKSGKYYYRIEAVGKNDRRDLDIIEVNIEVPKKYVLYQNYPNPFNPSTTIAFELPVDSHVRLEIYNTAGQKVKEIFVGELPAGYHKFTVDGRDLSSGVYLYILRAGNFVDVKKMVLVK